MDESSRNPASRMRWIVAGAVGLVAAIVITWGIIVNVPGGPGGDADGRGDADGLAGTSASQAAPSQVEDLPAPTPGKTTPVTKSKPPLTVDLTERAEPLPDTFVEVVSVEAVTAGRAIPGEPSGPAVKVSVRLVNDSGTAVSTSGASVNLSYNEDDQTPAVSLSSDDTAPWPQEVPAGQRATAVFVFALPDVVRGDIRVIVDLLATGPDVVFEGPRP